ncbi:MAG: hypothetical protein ACRCWF_10395 [Beijerinckiaceae bacterium]
MDIFSLSFFFSVVQIALLVGGLYLTASGKNDESKRAHRAFGWTLQGFFFLTMGYRILPRYLPADWFSVYVGVFIIFSAGAMFGIGMSRLFPEQGQLRTYVSRKLLGS